MYWAGWLLLLFCSVTW